MNIKIDNEFRTLITPLTQEEFSGLEALCLKHGIKDSLKTWNGILIDGHNRYEIAQKHNLTYRIDEMEFESRDDVKMWIIDNQLDRRNLDKWQRFDLAKKREAIVRANAKERMTAGVKTDPTEKLPEGDTRDIMGKMIGVSGKTYDKMKAIDESDNEDVKQAVRNKEMSIDKAYREVKGLPPKKTAPQIEEPVQEEPLPFEEDTSDCFETSEEVSEAIEIAGLRSAEKILNGIAEIVNTVKYSHEDVVEKISQLDCDGFSRDEFLSSVDECMKVLARLQNGLKGLTVRND